MDLGNGEATCRFPFMNRMVYHITTLATKPRFGVFIVHTRCRLASVWEPFDMKERISKSTMPLGRRQRESLGFPCPGTHNGVSPSRTAGREGCYEDL